MPLLVQPNEASKEPGNKHQDVLAKNAMTGACITLLHKLHIGYMPMPPCTSIRDQVFKDIKDPIAELDGRFWKSNS